MLNPLCKYFVYGPEGGGEGGLVGAQLDHGALEGVGGLVDLLPSTGNVYIFTALYLKTGFPVVFTRNYSKLLEITRNYSKLLEIT